MKKKVKYLIATLLFAVVFTVTGMTAQAETVKPATPDGINLYSQDYQETTYSPKYYSICWNMDGNLPFYSDTYSDYGYEIVVTNLNGKQIISADTSINSSMFKTDGSKVYVMFSNPKLHTQGIKVKVRSFVYDQFAQKIYSDYSSEKVIFPRANITNKSLKGGKVKITWKKVSGAKSYTVYMSSNDGKSFKKVGTTSKNNFTISKKLTRYKDYWVYVQANDMKYKKKKYGSTKPITKSSNSSGFRITTVYR